MWSSFYIGQYVEHTETFVIFEVAKHTILANENAVMVNFLTEDKSKQVNFFCSALRPFWLQAGDKVQIDEDEVCEVKEIFLSEKKDYIVRFMESSSWAYLKSVESLEIVKQI